jgi:hypothetical protein
MRSLIEDEPDDKLGFPSDGMSLDLLRAIYRSRSQPLGVRMRAAIAALPHEAPRLQVTAQINENSFAKLLDARIAKLRAIEAGQTFEPQALIEAVAAPAPPVETKPPAPRTPDRRFRRF